MMWLADIRIAAASLKAAKLRTFMTIIGIIIGVAAVTTVLAVGEGARQAVASQVGQFGGNVSTVRPGKLSKDANGNISGYDLLANFNASTLSERDIKTIEGTPGVANATPIMGLRGDITVGPRSVTDTQIIGTTSTLPRVLAQRVKAGEFVNESLNRNTVVLGDSLANDLLDSDQTVGQRVVIRGEEYTVIGIMRHNEIPLALNGLFDVNRAAFVTLEAGKNLNQGVAQIQTINFRISDGENIEQVNARVLARLKAAHKAEDVAVVGSNEASEVTERLFEVLTRYTASVAAISLIVGGVGVMNIMLVAVTERTREIGIRKAVGATNAQIMRQFLTEAIIMSLTGGIVGVFVAWLLSAGISIQLSFSPIITLNIIASAIGVSLLVGIIFGIFPAVRASRKDPIEALRQLQ